MNEFFSLASCNSRNSPANKARSAWPVVCILAWSWLHGCAWKPFMRFEMIFSERILDSFFSGILDSNAQYSGFHKQKFPGFRNPDYLTWGDLFYRVCWVTSNKGKAVRVMVLKNGKNNSLMKWYVPLAYLLLWQHYTTILDTAVKVTTWGFGAKKIPVGPALHYVTQTLLWRYFRFLFLFSVLLFYKRFDVLSSRLFFFRFLIQSVIQSHIQTVKRSVIRSVTRSVIRSVIRSGLDFIDAKLKQSRTYQVRCRVEDFNPEPSALITILIGFWRWLAG